MSGFVSVYVIRILQIIWLDLLLSGDNAVVIALACRRLPPASRKIAIGLGAGAAVALRIVFAFFILALLSVPLLKLFGGALLIWIAVKLGLQTDREETGEPAASVWGAVKLIAVTDALMSLDNVLAITGAAHGDPWLVVFGLIFSVPLIIFGSTLFLKLLKRFVWLIWAGAALLGWVGGQMAASDELVKARLGEFGPAVETWAGPVGACLALGLIAALKRRGHKPSAEADKQG